ncbi:MAG: EamA family transporter [bacterium]
MNWLFFALISVLIYSTKNLFQRILMKEEKSDPYLHSIVYYIFGGCIALIISLFNGGFQYELSLEQLLLFIPLAFIATLGLVLLFKSFQTVEASENAIIQSSQKLWTVAGSFLFLSEIFSIKTALGTILIVAGIIISIWENKKLKFNQGVLLAFAAALLYSISDLLSFYLVRGMDPLSFMVYLYFLPVIIMIIAKPSSVPKLKVFFQPKRIMVLVWLALSSTVGSAFTFLAYKVGGTVGQITVILGLTTISSVLISIILLDERKNLVKKIIGAVVVVLGALLVI